MSLIEQAVRRLAELRRSGADSPDARSDVMTEAPFAGPDVVPVPEAMVRSMDARADYALAPMAAPVIDETLPPAQARRAAIARSDSDGRSKLRGKSAPPSTTKPRLVEFDL